MKILIAVALATTALITATPSYAQDGNDALRGLRSFLGNPPPDPAERDLVEQERHLTDMIEESARDPRIDRGQTDRAFEQLRTIHDQQEDLRNRHGGRLTPGDHDYLRDRLAGLDREVDHMRQATYRQRGNGDFWESAPRSLDEREDWLDRKIHDGMADGSLDRREAMRSLGELRSIRDEEARDLRHDYGNLNEDHRAELNDRLTDLGHQLHWRRSNG